jgi:hypothetical protein
MLKVKIPIFSLDASQHIVIERFEKEELVIKHPHWDDYFMKEGKGRQQKGCGRKGVDPY